jgi:ParB-like chromosome segregation protein Spo0J
MMETSNKYQVMPSLSGEEYQALKEDIAENGVLVPVVKDTDGNIIDGHYRVRAYEELLAEHRVAGGYPAVERSDMTDQEKRDLAWRLNMQRRHLNRAQKHKAIERKLKESPEWADNRIAKLLGVDGKTVRLARVMLEGRKEIAKLKKLIGSDGKEYPRELEKKFKDMGFNRTFAKGLTQLATTRERAEGPLRGAGVEAGEEFTEAREQLKGERSEDKDDYDYAQSLMAEVKEGGEEIEKIVRIPVAEYVVKRKDGNTMRVARKVLLEAGWKKCSCCDGYGITNSA